MKNVKEKIIDAARSIFARYGFKKTTMDDIAHAAHKAKSSLYHYFKSKQEVFHAVVEKEVKILKKELNDALDKAETSQGKLRAYVVTRMVAFKRLANFYNSFKDEYLEQYAFIQRLRRNYDRYELEMIKKILRLGVNQGIFSIKDLELTAFAIVTAMKGLEYHWAFEEDIKELEEKADSLLEILFYGII